MAEICRGIYSFFQHWSDATYIRIRLRSHKIWQKCWLSLCPSVLMQCSSTSLSGRLYLAHLPCCCSSRQATAANDMSQQSDANATRGATQLDIRQWLLLIMWGHPLHNPPSFGRTAWFGVNTAQHPHHKNCSGTSLGTWRRAWSVHIVWKWSSFKTSLDARSYSSRLNRENDIRQKGSPLLSITCQTSLWCMRSLTHLLQTVLFWQVRSVQLWT